jgi:hypothetical protein
MAWLRSLLRPNAPDTRLDRARRMARAGEYNDARIELLDVDLPEARALYAQTLAALVELNLDEARTLASAGDREGANEAFDRARAFGATPEQLDEAGRRRSRR